MTIISIFRERNISLVKKLINIHIQEEIYDIMGEEVNLYLAGVNR